MSGRRSSSARKSLGFALLFGLFLTGEIIAQDRPNIVVILADDLGYGDVGFNGSPDIPTPNIDALAANGVRCNDGYVTQAFCAPSRAALLTGRYQQRYGFEIGTENDNDNPLLGLPVTETTLAELLKPAGYVCGIFGKWHLGTAPGVFPLARGFDEFVGFLDAEAMYYNTLLYNGYTIYREQTYLTDAFTREAVSFINNHAAQPFFLYLAYNAVHKPYNLAPDVYQQIVSYIPDPDRRNYAAMAVALDAGVGQVVQTLQANNLLDNTLIFFLSDNGAPNSPFTVNSNLPLRGYKTDLLEGGIRVPFAIQWPGKLPPNTVYDGMVSSLDIVTTVASAVGIQLPLDRVYDGLNIIPYLTGEHVSPLRTFYWRWLGLGSTGPAHAEDTIWAVHSGAFKLVVERAKDRLPPALYNLDRDIGETRDLSRSIPSKVASLQSLFALWQADTIPGLWQNDTDAVMLPVVLAGDWNDFNKDDPNPPWNLTSIKAPDPIGTPDAYNWLSSTIHVAANGGDTTPGNHSFNIIAQGDYQKQWAEATINIDGITVVPRSPDTGLATSNTIIFDDNSYYSFRIIDIANQPLIDMSLAVFKTSAPPVTVTRTGQIPTYPGPTTPITVNIATNQPLSPEERIFVRWSNDFFLHSNLVEATGSETSHSATIPPQPAGISALYTIVTSTVDLTPYTDSGVIDQLTLAMNGVFNATPPLPPKITRQPQNITVTVGATATFAVKGGGSGPFKYQWRKNGVNIPGAIRASYTTPPVTIDDNGAAFSVIVTGRASSVLSRDATLTVM
jgi:arylsulfatase A-like enzyme